jgi:hypothetical protein
MNPYEVSDSSLAPTTLYCNKNGVRALQGFFVGGAIPLVLGLLMLLRFKLSLPVLQPGEAHCGTGALGPVCIVLFGSPIGAILGTTVGSALRRA